MTRNRHGIIIVVLDPRPICPSRHEPAQSKGFPILADNFPGPNELARVFDPAGKAGSPVQAEPANRIVRADQAVRAEPDRNVEAEPAWEPAGEAGKSAIFELATGPRPRPITMAGLPVPANG